MTYPRNLNYIGSSSLPLPMGEFEELRKTVERVSPVYHLVTDAQNIDHGTLYNTHTPIKREGKTLDGLREFLVDKYASTRGATPIEGASPKQTAENWRQPLRAHIKFEGSTGIRNVRTDVGNF